MGPEVRMVMDGTQRSRTRQPQAAGAFTRRPVTLSVWRMIRLFQLRSESLRQNLFPQGSAPAPNVHSNQSQPICGYAFRPSTSSLHVTVPDHAYTKSTRRPRSAKSSDLRDVSDVSGEGPDTSSTAPLQALGSIRIETGRAVSGSPQRVFRRRQGLADPKSRHHLSVSTR